MTDQTLKTDLLRLSAPAHAVTPRGRIARGKMAGEAANRIVERFESLERRLAEAERRIRTLEGHGFKG